VKIYILLFFVLWHNLFWSQIHIRGKVTDAQTGETLPFADVYVDRNHGIISDYNGKFLLELPPGSKSFKVSYLGYETQKIIIEPGKKFYEIKLIPKAENLQAVEISAGYIDPAVLLIRKAVKRKKYNDFRRAKIPYEYSKYIRMVVDADTAAIEREFDTIRIIFIAKNGKRTEHIKTDSSLYELKKDLKDKYLWIYETFAQVTGVGDGKEKTKVLAIRTAGIKKPLYELIAMQLASQNLYDDYYKWMFVPYLSPLSGVSEKHYDYEIEDTLQIQGRDVIEVGFSKREKPPVVGYVYLDKKTLAIAGMKLNTYKGIQYNADYQFDYLPQAEKWIPSKTKILIKKADAEEGQLLGFLKFAQKKNDTIVKSSGDTIINIHSNLDSDINYIRIKYLMKVKDFKWNRRPTKKIRYSLEVDPLAWKRDTADWHRMVPESVHEKEVKTYQFIDSLAAEENVDYVLSRKKKILYGYFPLGKYVDWDFLNLMQYNLYEGLRLNATFNTSEYFSNKWQFRGYLGYGFKDNTFKYGLNVHYLIYHPTQTMVKFEYKNDLEKWASFSPVLYSKIHSSLLYVANNKFYGSEGWKIGLSHLLTPTLNIEANYAHKNIRVLNDEQKNTISGTGLLRIMSLSVYYTPFTEFMLTDLGRMMLKKGYPDLFVRIERGKAEGAKKSYLRLEAQFIWQAVSTSGHVSGLVLRGGYADAHSPPYKWFSPFTNDPPETLFFKRITLANSYSFQTLKDLEWNSPMLFSAHIYHMFPGIRFGKKYKIFIRLVGRLAYRKIPENSLFKMDSHKRFVAESGLELVRIWSSLGLGIYMRITPRHDQFRDNIALRLKFSLNRKSL